MTFHPKPKDSLQFLLREIGCLFWIKLIVHKSVSKRYASASLGSATSPNCGEILKVLTTKLVAKVSGGVC